jgi:hypothetical protein
MALDNSINIRTTSLQGKSPFHNLYISPMFGFQPPITKSFIERPRLSKPSDLTPSVVSWAVFVNVAPHQLVEGGVRLHVSATLASLPSSSGRVEKNRVHTIDSPPKSVTLPPSKPNRRHPHIPHLPNTTSAALHRRSWLLRPR